MVVGLVGLRVETADCKCAHISVDVAKVSQTLRNGGVPAVNIITEGEGTDIKLEIVNIMPNSQPYLAISHVWSDGLGNERANSLPKCQIQKLQGIRAMMPISGGHHRDVTVHVDETNRSNSEIQLEKNHMPIWIDTLCVPLNEDRHLALETLGRTFQEASSVLVLDTDLQHASLHAR
jgi:hypothetical protein